MKLVTLGYWAHLRYSMPDHPQPEWKKRVLMPQQHIEALLGELHPEVHTGEVFEAGVGAG